MGKKKLKGKSSVELSHKEITDFMDNVFERLRTHDYRELVEILVSDMEERLQCVREEQEIEENEAQF